MDVEAPIDRVVMCMEDCQFQLECNSRLKTLEVIDELSPTTNIIHQLSKSNFIVSGREFYMFAALFHLKNGKRLLSNHSIEYEDGSGSKAIRGRVNAIFLFESVTSKRTNVINILNVDLKGSIPSLVSNKMADMQHESFDIIRKKIESYHHTI